MALELTDELRATLEREAEVGLNSGPATPWTAADMEELRRRFTEKHGPKRQPDENHL